MIAQGERPEDGQEEAEYPAGAEVPDDPPGVGEGDLDEDQPGLLEDPPRAD